MNLAKIKSYAAHYALGLIASCWNAGIRAVKLAGGMTTAAAAVPAHVPMPNLTMLVTVFAAAVFWEAIDYFSDNQLPVVAPPATPKPVAP